MYVFFFFFKQKTAYEMRNSDWSSDVCSSDLTIADTGLSTVEASVAQQHRDAGMKVSKQTVQSRTLTSICEQYAQDHPIHFLKIDEIGRASCRERVCQYV